MTWRRALRIAGITSLDFYRRLDGRSWNPAWRWHERRVPLVHVVTEDGTCGLGEGWSADNDTQPFHTRLSQVAPALIGADTGAIEAIHATLWSDADWAAASVASAIDMALWDAQAQVRGVPLYALIGATHRAVPVYASGGLYADGQTTQDLGAGMRRYTEQGFRAVKLKIGAHGLADDLARVAAVRQAVGSDVAIIVDTLSRLPANDAAAWVAALAALGATSIQAPLPIADMARLAALVRDGRLIVIAGEAEFRPAVLHELVRRRSVGLLQVCAGLCGGITGTLRLAAMAQQAGIAITPQCHGTAVLQAASLHLGAGCDAVATVEYHMFHTHLHATLPDGMRNPIDGCMRLDQRPGVGIDAATLLAQGHDTMRAVATFG